MSKRLTKLDRMSQEEKDSISQSFWNAPDEAVFPPEDVAVVFNISSPGYKPSAAKVMVFPFTSLKVLGRFCMPRRIFLRTSIKDRRRSLPVEG